MPPTPFTWSPCERCRFPKANHAHFSRRNAHLHTKRDMQTEVQTHALRKNHARVYNKHGRPEPHESLCRCFLAVLVLSRAAALDGQDWLDIVAVPCWFSGRTRDVECHAECNDIAKAVARQVQVPHLRWSRAPPLPTPRQGSADFWSSLSLSASLPLCPSSSLSAPTVTVQVSGELFLHNFWSFRTDR